MHRRIYWAGVAVFSVACASAAFAQTKDKPAMKGGSAMQGGAMCPSTDAEKLKVVLHFLHEANQSEIKQAKLAMDRAQSQDVKDFADKMSKDHTDADKKLTDLAKKKNIDLSPMTPADPIHAAVHATGPKMMQALESKNGAMFEAAYIGPEVHEHNMVLAVIDEGMKVAKDAEVKKLLGDMQSAVTMHRDHASKLTDKLKLGTSQQPVGGGPQPMK